MNTYGDRVEQQSVLMELDAAKDPVQIEQDDYDLNTMLGEIESMAVGDQQQDKPDVIPTPTPVTTTVSDVRNYTSEYGRPTTDEAGDDDEGGIMADLGKGVIEAPRAMWNGTLKAIDATYEFQMDLNDIIAKAITGKGVIENIQGSTLADHILADAESKGIMDWAGPGAESTTGKAIESITQFIVGMAGGGKLIRAGRVAKAGGEIAEKGLRAGMRRIAPTTVKGQGAEAIGAGMIAGTVARDPMDPLLSEMAASWWQGKPLITEMTADPEAALERGGPWERRMYHAIEEAGLGFMGEMMMQGFRVSASAIRTKRLARQARKQQEALERGDVDVSDVDLEGRITERDIIDLGLADEDAPMLIEGRAGETQRQAFERVFDARLAQKGLDLTQDARNLLAAVRDTLGKVELPEDYGKMLQTLRKATAPYTGPKYPVLGTLKRLGGVQPGSPLAQELQAIGVTQRTMPGIFKNGGRETFDNIPLNEFDDTSVMSTLADDGAGYIDQNSMLDAVGDELAGNPRLAPEMMPEQEWAEAAEQFGQMLDEMGIDVTTATDQQIAQAVRAMEDEASQFQRTLLSAEEAAAQSDAAMAREAGGELADEGALDMPGAGAVDERTPPPVGRNVDAPIEGKIYINHARIDGEDDIKALIQEMADRNATAINKARGGEKQTHADMLDRSKDEYWDLTELLGREPGPMSASQALAARQILYNSGEQVAQLAARAASANATKSDMYAFGRASAVHNAIAGVVLGARTQTARALNSWKIPIGGTDKMRARAIENLTNVIENSGSTKKSAIRIANLMDNPQAANRQIAKEGNQMLQRAGDMLHLYYIGNLLSSVPTHVANLMGGSMALSMNATERYFASRYAKAVGDDMAVHEAETIGLLKGYYEGLIDVTNLVVSKFMRNKEAPPNYVSDTLSKLEVHPDPFSGIETGPKWLRHGLGEMGEVVGLVPNALNAGDIGMKMVAYRGELRALAIRQAAQEGYEGDAMAKRIARIIQNPPEDIMDAAMKQAEISTFTQPLGYIGQQVQKAFRAIPVVGWVMAPFIRTPINLAKYSLARTPLAALHTSFWKDVNAGGARAANAWARMGQATLISTWVADKTMRGEITGNGPSDPRLRKVWMLNNKPYTIKLGNKTFRYSRLDPLGMMIGLNSDITGLMMDVNDPYYYEDDNTPMLLAGFAQVLINNLASKTYLSGVFDFMGAINQQDPTKDIEGALNDVLGSLLMPGAAMVGVINRSTDDYLRETRAYRGEDYDVDIGGYDMATRRWFGEMIQDMQGRYASQDLPKRYDMLGRPMTREGSSLWRFLMPINQYDAEKDPVAQMLIDNGIVISDPNSKYQGVPMNAEEYSEFSRIRGEMYYEQFDAVMNSRGWNNLNQYQRKDIIKEIRLGIGRDMNGIVHTKPAFRRLSKLIQQTEQRDMERMQ